MYHTNSVPQQRECPGCWWWCGDTSITKPPQDREGNVKCDLEANALVILSCSCDILYLSPGEEKDTFLQPFNTERGMMGINHLAGPAAIVLTIRG